MYATKASEIIDTEAWFEVQYSRRDENDWFSSADRYDTEERARDREQQLSYVRAAADFQYRVVRKVITTEVL